MEDKSSGLGYVTGGPGTMNSFRAEAQGVASILANSTNEEIQGAQLYLDNQGVVRRLQQIWPIHPLRPEWKLIEPSRQRLQTCHVNTYHVKGHQKTKPSAPREVHMNNTVDALATAAHTSSDTIGSTPPGYGVILYINGEPITGQYGKAIHHAATTPNIRDYYAAKHGWTNGTLQTVDWEAFEHALARFTTLQQRNIHKYVHNWLPTGEVQDRRYHTTTKFSQCPQGTHETT